MPVPALITCTSPFFCMWCVIKKQKQCRKHVEKKYKLFLLVAAGFTFLHYDHYQNMNSNVIAVEETRHTTMENRKAAVESKESYK